MEVTLSYAIGFGASMILMALYHRLYAFTQYVCPLILEVPKIPPTPKLSTYLYDVFCRYLLYPASVRRRKFIDRWSRHDVLLLLLYCGANVSCLIVDYQGISKAGLRAGTLSLINMSILFAGPHLSFLADILGLPIRVFRRLHVSAGLISLVFAVFHSIVGVATKEKFSLNAPKDLFALIVGKRLSITTIHELTCVGYTVPVLSVATRCVTPYLVRFESSNAPDAFRCSCICHLASHTACKFVSQTLHVCSSWRISQLLCAPAKPCAVSQQHGSVSCADLVRL